MGHRLHRNGCVAQTGVANYPISGEKDPALLYGPGATSRPSYFWGAALVFPLRPTYFGGFSTIMDILEQHVSKLDVPKLVKYALRYPNPIGHEIVRSGSCPRVNSSRTLPSNLDMGRPFMQVSWVRRSAAVKVK